MPEVEHHIEKKVVYNQILTGILASRFKTFPFGICNLVKGDNFFSSHKQSLQTASYDKGNFAGNNNGVRGCLYGCLKITSVTVGEVRV